MGTLGGNLSSILIERNSRPGGGGVQMQQIEHFFDESTKNIHSEVSLSSKYTHSLPGNAQQSDNLLYIIQWHNLQIYNDIITSFFYFSLHMWERRSHSPNICGNSVPSRSHRK